jgi:hypothetical protein
VPFDVRTTIAVPAADAFDRMADARNETTWNSQVSRSELVSGGPVGPGARFKTVNRGKPYDATIVTYERPHRLVFEVTGPPMDITATFGFEPDGDGAGDRDATVLTGHFDMRPKGFMKLALPVLSPAVRRDLRKQMEGFRAFCEHAAP